MRNVVFQAGRLPYDPSLPNMTLRLSVAAVAPPVSGDWLDKVDVYPMYDNDKLGDCTAAGAGHAEQGWTAEASSEVTVPDSDVVTFYSLCSGYDPSTGENDDGAVMQTCCGVWRKTGLGGHKILGFAQIDHTNPDQVRAAIASFGGLYVGVNFPNAAMDQFNREKIWTPVRGDKIEGGHCIWVGAYDADTLTCVTWADKQQMTQSWWDTYVEEAWVLVTQEWIEANGDTPAGQAVADLGAQFTELTGEASPFPAPSPQPEPTPEPTPTPDPVDPPAVHPHLSKKLASALERFLPSDECPSYLKEAGEAWLEHFQANHP